MGENGPLRFGYAKQPFSRIVTAIVYAKDERKAVSLEINFVEKL